jgi:hypothetical protein
MNLRETDYIGMDWIELVRIHVRFAKLPVPEQ